MNFDFNLNKSLSSIEEIYTPKFESDEIIFADCGNNSSLGLISSSGSFNCSGVNGSGNNQYKCEIHPNFKLSMICVECTTLVCPCCLSLPIHSSHQHFEVESDSIMFKKIYYCMTNCKEKIDNVMEIAMNEFENIRNQIKDKDLQSNNIPLSIDTQVEIFLDFIDLVMGDNNII